eukprot:m.9239 g.9239  ORF g.9239 m.9239 type:complete len:70 (+) comp4029_c0_seq1:1297-1506(+)
MYRAVQVRKWMNLQCQVIVAILRFRSFPKAHAVMYLTIFPCKVSNLLPGCIHHILQCSCTAMGIAIVLQ